jgi:aminopeptidase N
VYDFGSVRDYINAVYLNGARMLEALRTDMGTEAFFAWLGRYAAAGRSRIMQPGDLWRLLSLEELAATEATRLRFLGTTAF